jgi:hypothetical protein
MSRAPSWLEPVGGTSADTLYDSMEATEGDKLGETVREEKKREKGLPTVRSFRELPHRPRRGRTPPPVKAATVSQIQAGDARGPSMSIDLQLRRQTPTRRVGGRGPWPCLTATTDHWGSLATTTGEERYVNGVDKIQTDDSRGNGENDGAVR